MYCRTLKLPALLSLCLLSLLLLSCNRDGKNQNTTTSFSWKWNNPSPQGNWLSSVIWDGTSFVAVGGAATVIKSTDGINWEWIPYDSDISRGFSSIAYGNGIYVAVGGRCTVYHSHDGEIWNQDQSGLPEENCNLTKVIWTGSQFVAIGGSSQEPPIIRSQDGIQWTISNSTTDTTLYDLSWNGSQLVAVGDSGVILASNDGVDWTTATSNTTSNIRNLAWSDTEYVAIADDGVILTSSDGTNWIELANTLPSDLQSLIWDGSRFIAAGYLNVYLSDDGSSWTTVPLTNSPPPSEWVSAGDLVWNGSLYVLVGDRGAIMTSEDALTWTWRSTGNRYYLEPLSTIEHNGQYWLAFGYNDKVLISPNGLDWESVAVEDDFRVHNMTWAGSQWVATELFDGIITSPDGRNWTRYDPDPSYSNLKSITWNGSVVVGVGDGGKILTSPDGNTWTIQTLPGSPDMVAIAWGDGKFVAVGYTGKVFTSIDGVTWQQQQALTTTYGGGQGLVWTGTQFVLVSNSGNFATSPDGVQWTSHSWPPLKVFPPSMIVMADDLLVAVGSLSGTQAVFTSQDGINWEVDYYSLPTTQTIYDIAYADGCIVLVGENGILLSAEYP